VVFKKNILRIKKIYITALLIFISGIISPDAFSQMTGFIGNFKVKPEKQIKLPKLKSNSNYHITNKRDYYSVFNKRYHKKLPEIDFLKYILVGTTVDYAGLKNMENDIYLVKKRYAENQYYYKLDINTAYYNTGKPHKYEPIWFLIKKIKPETVNFIKLDIEETEYLSDSLNVVITNDSMYYNIFNKEKHFKHQKPDFSDYVILGMKDGADCNAHFEYELVNNRENKTYTLNVYYIYCGCHEMKKWEHWI